MAALGERHHGAIGETAGLNRCHGGDIGGIQEEDHPSGSTTPCQRAETAGWGDSPWSLRWAPRLLQRRGPRQTESQVPCTSRSEVQPSFHGRAVPWADRRDQEL